MKAAILLLIAGTSAMAVYHGQTDSALVSVSDQEAMGLIGGFCAEAIDSSCGLDPEQDPGCTAKYGRSVQGYIEGPCYSPDFARPCHTGTSGLCNYVWILGPCFVPCG